MRSDMEIWKAILQDVLVRGLVRVATVTNHRDQGKYDLAAAPGTLDCLMRPPVELCLQGLTLLGLIVSASLHLGADVQGSANCDHN